MQRFLSSTTTKATLQKVARHNITHAVAVLLLCTVCAFFIASDAQKRYETLLSPVVYDRTGVPLSIKQNAKGHYAYELTSLPDSFTTLLISKEDRYFYFHPGFNPGSSVRALYNLITNGKAGGSSTLTQQLAKNILQTESHRTVINKIRETIYALSLELFTSKEKILLMYANTVYLGNQVQGFGTASIAYFDTSFNETTYNEQISLLATLSHPSSRNPWEKDNATFAGALSTHLRPQEPFMSPQTTDSYSFQTDAYFELRTAGVVCDSSCTTTIDSKLTEGIRNILNKHIEKGLLDNIRNGAVVVINPETSEILALVGSRNPGNDTSGNQINMAIEPRPIGSTIKPLLYAQGFEKGLRPFTTVEDREYKYPIATGFSLYPKNYDGKYHGEVTLHEALSNSLNVPSVKVLEYIGLDTFYSFLSNELGFEPIQPYDSYQYGIALGGLEMDLVTLTHYFTVFPQKGTLSPIRILKNSNNNFDLPPQSHITQKKEVITPASAELVHAIISDRFTGVNQFGLESNLNINAPDYGVKTGTSRDFHDSWVVGYTPNFVVGVWIGNSENEPLKQVTGQSGAGSIWHDVMEYLLESEYASDKKMTLTHIERFSINGNDELGLKGDVTEEHLKLLQENTLILSVHHNDQFELTEDTSIPLRARTEVAWEVNGEVHGTGREVRFSPTEVGTYEISAYDRTSGIRERLDIVVTLKE